jgi:signal transduction histidine kinase
MKEAAEVRNPGGPPFRPLTPLLVGAYLSAHVLLDWVSFIHEAPPLNITPWNPAIGLALAFLLVCGPLAIGWVAAALIAADFLVRGLPANLALTAVSAFGVAGIYGLAAWLLRTRCDFDPFLTRLRDLLWLFVVGPGGAMLTAIWFVGFFIAAGWYSWGEFPSFAFRYWLGDMIGIVVLTPMLLIHAWGRRWPPRSRTAAEGVLLGVAIVSCLVLVFRLPPGVEGRLFYLLFLPAIWIAVRHGLEGATLVVVFTQAGLIAGILFEGYGTPAMVSFQLLMLVVAVTTQLLGAVVGERRRIEARLKEQQGVLAHAMRLTEAGEMVSALAHELNQPLTAAISYGRAARKALAGGDGPAPMDLLEKSIAQAERADQVMRGLRSFLRKGDTRQTLVDVPEVIGEMRELAFAETRRRDVRLRIDLTGHLPKVRANRLQLQQVLLNLVRNGIEAAGTVPGGREVAIEIRSPDPATVEFSVRDSGPGIAPEIRDRLFQPFVTTKPSGMGLGLSIGASLIEAHGGRLTARNRPEGGAEFMFSLPAALEEDDDLD